MVVDARQNDLHDIVSIVLLCEVCCTYLVCEFV